MTHLSLCSGIGGLDLAAEWAGFETCGQCEIDDYASRVLAKNFEGVPNLHDIRTVTSERLRECGIDVGGITVISAGFPCQPYSLAGKGLGDSDERDLWGEVARVLEDVRPRWFVGENTPGLFSRQNQRFFRRVLSDLAALGYSVGWGVWGACDVGAPHRRDRVFIVAHRDDGRGETLQERDISDARSERKIERRRGELFKTSRIEMPRADYGRGAEKYVGGEWWEVEPGVGRVANGIPDRVDRLRCLGNAVVPAQAYPIFKAIAEYESNSL